MPYCQKCATKIKKGDDFCPKCGKKTKIVVEKVVTKEKIVEKPVEKKKHSDFKIFLMYFFGVIAFIIGIALFFVGCPATLIAAGATEKLSLLWFLIIPFAILILGAWLIFKAKRMSK